MMSNTHVVGRLKEAESLSKVLLGETRGDGRLTIQSIEGPGGIGKTTLLDHVRSGTPLSDRRYLRLGLRGRPVGTTSPFNPILDMVSSASIDGLTDGSLRSRFPEVESVAVEYDRLIQEGVDEFRRLDPEFLKMDRKTLEDRIKSAAALGKSLNEILPTTLQHVNFVAMEEHASKLEYAFRKVNTFRREAPSLIERLLPGGKSALRNALRDNALEPLASALERDLYTILGGGRSLVEKFRPMQPRHGKVERLLLEIDDYESMAEPIGRMLVEHLLPKLARAPFDTLVLILGRDQLRNTHTGWAQHLGKHLSEPIVLDTFSRTELDDLCALQGIHDAGDRERIWSDTQGYPLQIELWLQEMHQSGGKQAGGPSAMTLKRFYDRTTRWMDDRERSWLECFLFVDIINKQTGRAMLDNPEEIKDAFAWIVNEGSVRDPWAAVITVRSFARSRLLGYMKLTDPERHSMLEKRAASVAAVF